MTNSYSRACTEVLVLLRTYLKEEDYNRIPKEVIEFYEKNKDNNYKYEIDINLPIEKQEISEKANAIIITIFRDYFATENQIKKLEQILIDNDRIIEERKREKYNPYDIFKKEPDIENFGEDKHVEMIEYKEENMFIKMLKKIKRFFKNLKNK